jgi:hypothetical protein
VKHGKIFLMILIFLLCTSVCWPQGSTGNLVGWTINSEGEKLMAVRIVLSGPSLQGGRETISDKKGYFYFSSLPVGKYTVTITHSDYQEVKYINVHVHLGKTTSLGKIRLQAYPTQKHVITVFGERPLIDTSTTSIGNNLVDDTFRSLPLERNYRDMAFLMPEANKSFYGDEVNISGSTGFENVYFIDGVNVTDPYLGATGTNLPYNFIKEIEVKTGGFEAEYGRTLGGIINVITHSGSNRFHGQVFGFFTNNNLAGKDKQGLLLENIDAYTTYDIGLSLGGPIIRNKLWFFGAYNPNHQSKDIVIPGLGPHQDTELTHVFAGKLTWQATKNLDLVLTILGDMSSRNRIGTTYAGLIPIPKSLANPDPYLGKVEKGGINLSLQGRYFINQNLLLEGNLSRLTRDLNDIPKTETGRTQPLYADLLTGYWSGGYGRYLKSRAIRTAAKLKASLFIGRHILKAGIEFEDNFLDFLLENRVGNTGHNPSIIVHQAESSYLASFSTMDVNVHNKVLSAFIQDSWQVSERLKLSAGLRCDGQYLVGSDGKISQRIINQWQPRFGFNLQLGELGRQQIFGSYARYYEQLSANFPSTYYSTSVSHYIWYSHNPLIDPSGGFVQDISQSIYPEISNLKGQHIDEIILGYERQFGKHLKLSVKGIYRNLLQVIEDGLDPGSMTWVLGNPGSGALSFFPKFKRKYSSIQFSLEKSMGRRFHFFATYVLSRTYGNYPGLFNGDFASNTPNASPSFDIPDQLVDGTGLLPNDRPHIFKFFGTYYFKSGFTLGTSFICQSGTPLNEYGSSWLSAEHLVFLRPRGSAGRTPSLWDLNLRVTYPLMKSAKSSFRPKLILDIFHLFSSRKPLSFDQLHFMALDESGNQIGLNPNYGMVNLYQRPMIIRLGMEVDF